MTERGQMLTDAELMSRTAAGDDDAFSILVDRYKLSMVRYLTHLTGNREHAEELAQESFVRLYFNAGRYREEGKLSPFLYRIATNLVRSEKAKAKRWQLLYQMIGRAAAAPQENPQRQLLSREVSERVSAAMDQLPVHFRAALVLREIEGWSYEEIAATLGCNQGTVKSRISRGRDMLRKLLAPYWLGEKDERTEHRRASSIR
jgi:RNA polymerase sigma-70 factor (ECF subfamily)